MLYASILIVILILAMLVYALAANPKAANLGLVAFGCSLLVICFHIGAHAVQLLK